MAYNGLSLKTPFLTVQCIPWQITAVQLFRSYIHRPAIMDWAWRLRSWVLRVDAAASNSPHLDKKCPSIVTKQDFVHRLKIWNYLVLVWGRGVWVNQKIIYTCGGRVWWEGYWETKEERNKRRQLRKDVQTKMKSDKFHHCTTKFNLTFSVLEFPIQQFWTVHPFP